MVESTCEIQRLRRRLHGTANLEDRAMRARLEKSYKDSERTIKEWNDFVCGRDRALRPKRAVVTAA